MRMIVGDDAGKRRRGTQSTRTSALPRFQPTYNTSTNQYSTLPSSTPSYDADGNVLADGFHNYTWDADGNPVTIDGSSMQLTFDALDRMVEQNASGSYTQIVYGTDGIKLALMNGQTLNRGRVPLPGGGRAVYTGGPTLIRYWHPDWLGSTRVGSNPNQTISGTDAYAPYGEQYAATVEWGDFTGQWAATEPDLYDFLYREYHSTQGRWLTPDPAGLAAVDPTNPQSWNRYAYVLNNPLGLVDPLGLCPQGTHPANAQEGQAIAAAAAALANQGNIKYGSGIHYGDNGQLQWCDCTGLVNLAINNAFPGYNEAYTSRDTIMSGKGAFEADPSGPHVGDAAVIDFGPPHTKYGHVVIITGTAPLGAVGSQGSPNDAPGSANGPAPIDVTQGDFAVAFNPNGATPPLYFVPCVPNSNNSGTGRGAGGGGGGSGSPKGGSNPPWSPWWWNWWTQWMIFGSSVPTE